MNQSILLIGLFIAGIILQQLKITPNNFYKKINKFIIYFPLPAIVLTKIPHLSVTKEVLFPVSSAWIIFFCSVLFAYLVSRKMHYDNQTMACIILCCGLGNTSFVGYPILHYFYGDGSIKHAIFVDQPGTFLILSTFGILIAAYYGSGNISSRQLLKRLFTFPPFIVFVIALYLPSKLISGTLFSGLEYLGMLMIPLAILSLGWQFKWNLKEIEWKKFMIAVSYKLLLAPLIIYIIFFVLLQKQGEIYTVSVMECAMPPMITSSIIATEYGLDEKLANTLPTLGILLSIPTLLFWKWVL